MNCGNYNTHTEGKRLLKTRTIKQLNYVQITHLVVYHTDMLLISQKVLLQLTEDLSVKLVAMRTFRP